MFNIIGMWMLEKKILSQNGNHLKLSSQCVFLLLNLLVIVDTKAVWSNYV